MKFIAAVQPYTMVAHLDQIQDIVQRLDHDEIPGAFVECGVWRGGVVGLMGLTHLSEQKEPPYRKLVLCDSFEGLPEAKAELDGEAAMTHTGTCCASLGEVQQFMQSIVNYPNEYLSWYAGWFKDTMGKASSEIGPIAFLRLDAGWYESTQQCLSALAHLVVPGGMLQFDDYFHWQGCARAVDEWFSNESGRWERLLQYSHFTLRRLAS